MLQFAIIYTHYVICTLHIMICSILDTQNRQVSTAKETWKLISFKVHFA